MIDEKEGQDPEDQEVENTQNPILKELREKLNDVEEIVEKLDEKDSLDSGEKLEVDSLTSSLEKFCNELGDEEGSNDEEDGDHKGIVIVIGHKEK